MGASFCWTEGDQLTIIFERLQPSQMLIPEGGSLLKSISAISSPKNKTSHSNNPNQSKFCKAKNGT